jgi:Delta14-sterol reductase
MNKEQQQASTQQQRPTTTTTQQFVYEFGGPMGAAAITVLLPVVVLLLAHWSDVGTVDLQFLSTFSDSYSSPSSASALSPLPFKFWDAYMNNPVLCPGCSQLRNYLLQNRFGVIIGGGGGGGGEEEEIPVLLYCLASILAWFLFQVLLERFLPCEIVHGAPIVVAGQGETDAAAGKTGKTTAKTTTLPYRINGHLALWVTLLVATAGWPTLVGSNDSTGPRRLQFTAFPHWDAMYDHFAELALVTIALCYVTNTYLYLSSFRPDGRVLAGGRDPNQNFFYGFFLGRELNPRIGATFDWKEFCELRPGMIGWLLLNLSSMHKQHHELGYVCGSMILLTIFQGLYVWDALYQERAILTTMDITTDGFGFMLLFGDLVWVPFTYSLQARYLVRHDPGLSVPALLAVVAVHAVGYAVFRGANGQKDAFRRDPADPAVADLRYLQTQRGTKLLISGWWGQARKINYTGDYIMGLSWCLVCGVDSIVPYYYAIYFLILLVHRSGRDDHMCSVKYGDDWVTYKTMVPYRFIPGVV